MLPPLLPRLVFWKVCHPALRSAREAKDSMNTCTLHVILRLQPHSQHCCRCVTSIVQVNAKAVEGQEKAKALETQDQICLGCTSVGIGSVPQHLFMELSLGANSKKFWSTVRSRNKSAPSILTLEHDSVTATSDKEKAELLNSFFS